MIIRLLPSSPAASCTAFLDALGSRKVNPDILCEMQVTVCLARPVLHTRPWIISCYTVVILQPIHMPVDIRCIYRVQVKCPAEFCLLSLSACA